MNRNQLTSNWPSKVIALVAFIGFTSIQGHAQTVLIQDNFTGSGDIGGTRPDTTDVPNTSWVYTGSYSRGNYGTSYTTLPVVTQYASDANRAAGISLGGLAQNILNLNISAYDGLGDSPLAFGFSTITVNNGNVGNGGYVGFVDDTGGLAILVNSDGSGNLNLSGGSVVSWSSPLDFSASTGEGSMTGFNTYTLSYNNVTDIATVTEAGDLVATANVGALNLNSAGFGSFYMRGTAYGPSPDGFAAFSVTTQSIATAPEPSTWALMLSGAVGLFFIRRMRSVSRL